MRLTKDDAKNLRLVANGEEPDVPNKAEWLRTLADNIESEIDYVAEMDSDWSDYGKAYNPPPRGGRI